MKDNLLYLLQVLQIDSQIVMPFSLTNTLIAFQQFINNIFSDLLDVCIVVYLNDILIYLDNIFQYKDHIKTVLCWLQKSRLYTKVEKYEFYFDSIEYLGYILFSSRLFMSSNKIKTI